MRTMNAIMGAMKELKQLRKIHHLSQQEMSRRTGIGRRRLGHFENGTRNPRPEEALAIRQAFRGGTRATPSLWAGESSSRELLKQAFDFAPALHRRVRHLLLEHPSLEQLPLATVAEAALLLRLLDRFRSLSFPSPLGIGFRLRGVVDPSSGHLISDLPQPVVELGERRRLLVGLHVDTARGRRRLGFLLKSPQGWLNLEAGRPQVWDPLRSEDLGMPVKRLDEAELRSGRVWECLESWAA